MSYPQKKEFKTRLKKGTLTEPLSFVIDTEKSIPIDETHMAVIGLKLDKNFNPETFTDPETGEEKERRIAVVVDGPPQRNGNIAAYYRNMAPYETREMLIAQALDPYNNNPQTRIGAAVMMFHEATSANGCVADESTGIKYPAYNASRYAHRAGITPEDAKQRMFYGIRMKMNITEKGTENQRITFDAYDLRKQVRVSNVQNNPETLKKSLGEVFDHITAQYKNSEYNKGFIVASFFGKTKEGEVKRLGKRIPANKEKTEWTYSDSPMTYRTHEKDESNKTKRRQRDREEFIERTFENIEKFTSRFDKLDVVLTPKYQMDIDNLAKDKFRMEEFLINKLSSAFHDSTVMTSPNRHFKYFQFFQYDPVATPYNLYNDTVTEVPVMSYEEYRQHRIDKQTVPSQSFEEQYVLKVDIVYSNFNDEPEAEEYDRPTPF